MKILRQLQHPNIVRLKDVLTDKANAADFLKEKGLSLPAWFLTIFCPFLTDSLCPRLSCKIVNVFFYRECKMLQCSKEVQWRRAFGWFDIPCC